MKSIAIEWHAWRGVSCARDLIDVILVAGFVTVYLCRESISERLRNAKDALRRLAEARP